MKNFGKKTDLNNPRKLYDIIFDHQLTNNTSFVQD